MTAALEGPEARLAYLNRRFAALLNRPQVSLDAGAAQTLADPLWVWGVVGGKDVGKTTLINALAGADVVPGGVKVGEGTYQPAAYLTAADEPGLRARFADRSDVPLVYHAVAPKSMQRLALVDLPDFDSLFTRHAAIVGRLAGVLDGVIWVVSPKKVADLAAIGRARDLLKDRGNFVYVVNKVDWLLAQSRHAPAEELDRLTTTLRAQIEGADGGLDSARSFFISARYRTTKDILAAIADARGPAAEGVNGAAMTATADRLAREFNNLRALLITPPDATDAATRKQANLTYQTTALAHRLIEHFSPRAVLVQTRQLLDADRLGEVLERFFSADYASRVAARLHGERSTISDWAGMLFEKRLTHWSGLGIIAWPAIALGNLLRRRWGGRGDGGSAADDAFRLDGVDLATRVQDLNAAMRSRLTNLPGAAHWEIPDARELAADVRRAVDDLRDADRTAALADCLTRRPTILGRAARRMLPTAILLWFPLIQPLAAGFLAIASDGLHISATTLLAVTQALSGSRVLSGLGAAIVLLAFLTAGVYARARNDAAKIWSRLETRDPEGIVQLIRAVALAPLVRPAERFAAELEDLTVEAERHSAAP